MSVAKKMTVAALAAAALVGVAVIADDMKDGAMTMIAPTGQMSTMTNANMVEKAKMNDIMKHAEEVKDGMIIMVWGQRLYVVKNEKMADGKMTFEYWGLHGEK